MHRHRGRTQRSDLRCVPSGRRPQSAGAGSRRGGRWRRAHARVLARLSRFGSGAPAAPDAIQHRAGSVIAPARPRARWQPVTDHGAVRCRTAHPQWRPRNCLGRRARGRWMRKGQEGRLVAVEDLPLVPQQHQRETKNHPQDGAADIVHEEDFLSSEVRKANSDLDCEVGRWAFGGTGSCPPWHQGWQRAMRRSVR